MQVKTRTMVHTKTAYFNKRFVIELAFVRSDASARYDMRCPHRPIRRFHVVGRIKRRKFNGPHDIAGHGPLHPPTSTGRSRCHRP